MVTTQVAAPLMIDAFRTALGYFAIAGRDGVLAQVTIGHATAAQAIRAIVEHDAESDPWNSPRDKAWDRNLRERMIAYAAGAEDDFRDVQIEMAHLTAFQQRVITACRRIAYGQTCSYGQLAARAGSPRAARAVGNTMAANRYPLVVPCHRVVASAGLGGFSAGRGLSLKNDLLALEHAVMPAVAS